MKRKRKGCRIFLAAAAVCLLIVAIWILYGKYRQSLIPGMSFEKMLAYAGWLLEESADPEGCTAKLCEVGETPESYRAMGIRMDAVAYGWMLDEENGFIWHNGGTGSYNCYLGVSPQKQCGVVVLSNLSPHTRIPATVMGVRLLEELTGEALP